MTDTIRDAAIEAAARALCAQRGRIADAMRETTDGLRPEWEWHVSEARAALANARAEALEEAATAATRAAWKHEGDDDYSRGMDRGAREQVEACAAAIRALKEGT